MDGFKLIFMLYWAIRANRARLCQHFNVVTIDYSNDKRLTSAVERTQAGWFPFAGLSLI